jgi:hypothetical protein
VDGELAVYRDSRCDFAALQERLHFGPRPATAALVVFDVLTLAGRDLRSDMSKVDILSMDLSMNSGYLWQLLSQSVPLVQLPPADYPPAG